MSPDSLAASACSDQFGEKLTGRKVYRTGGKHRLLPAHHAFSLVHLPRSRVGITVETFRPGEHTSELPSLMPISYAVFCFTKKNTATRAPLAHPLPTQDRNSARHNK